MTISADVDRIRLPLLDALRGIAAFGVLIYHAPGFVGASRLALDFYLFVDLFFLMSGFVMTLTAEPRLAKGWTTRDFMIARLRRLWPMMALGVLLCGLTYLWHEPLASVWPFVALALLLIPQRKAGQPDFPINPVEWSLVWELIANLIHGLILRRLGIGGLMAIALMAGGAGLAMGNGVWPAAETENWLSTGTRVIWSYTLGIVMARMFQKGMQRQIIRWHWALPAPVMALMAAPTLPIPSGMVEPLLVLFVLPVLFWCNCVAVPPLRGAKFMRRLGDMSYPLYATHIAVILAAGQISMSRAAYAMALLAALLLAALLAFWGDLWRWIGHRRQADEDLPRALSRNL